MTVFKLKVRKATNPPPPSCSNRDKKKRERLTSTKCTKVLSCLRDDIGTKDHFDATGRLATNGDIKEADGVSPVFSRALNEEKSRRRRNESRMIRIVGTRGIVIEKRIRDDAAYCQLNYSGKTVSRLSIA